MAKRSVTMAFALSVSSRADIFPQRTLESEGRGPNLLQARAVMDGLRMLGDHGEKVGDDGVRCVGVELC